MLASAQDGPSRSQDSQIPGQQLRPPLAYLTNLYPKVSHAFIRREILAVEQLGQPVLRYAVRGSREDLPDEQDRAERARTRVLLAAGWKALAWALGRAALTRPQHLARAARRALRLGWHSDRGLLRHGAYLVEACLLLRWLQQEGVRHVHVHFGTNPATVALLCHDLGGPRFSFTAHGSAEFERLDLIGMRTKIEQAAFVVAVSRFGRDRLREHCDPLHWPQIHVVHCGVNEVLLDRPGELPPAAGRLVCVARLAEQKGLLLLMDAVKLLVAQGLLLDLHLVGDGPLREKLQEIVARAGLSNVVHLDGWCSSAEVSHAIRAARALILPSYVEGLPVVIMEAFALCRPVVATRVGGVAELVEDGRTGWLVEAGDVPGLAAGLKAALETPPERLLQMGTSGRERVQREHRAAASAARILELIGQAGGQPGASR